MNLKLLTLALLGTAALTHSAFAQRQQDRGGTADQQQACGNLIDEVRQTSIDQRPITLRQARQLAQNNQTSDCRTWLQRLQQASSEQSTSTGDQTSSSRSQAAERSQITIRQQRPQVSIERARPEISIEQQRPTITIEIPPPRVTVRMPRPQVDVVGAQGGPGKVELSQDQQMQPRIQFKTAEPRVVVRQTGNQPQVSYESAGQDRTRNASAPSGQSGERQRVAASGLIDMDVVDRNGNDVGHVDAIISRSGQHYAIVMSNNRGQQRRHQVALNQLALDQDMLVVQQMTRQQFMRDTQTLAEVPQNQRVPQGRFVAIATSSGESDNDAQQDAQSGAAQAVRNPGAGSTSEMQRNNTSRSNAGMQAGQQQRSAANQSGATSADARQIRVDRLLEMSIYDQSGNLVGDIDRVVQTGNGDAAAIVGRGGFLGIGESLVSIPLQNARQVGDRLILQTITQAQVEAMPQWNESAGSRELDDNQFVTLGQS